MQNGSDIETKDRAPMVSWYDPGQLTQTAQLVLVSAIFGRYSDHRLMEALACGSEDAFDYSMGESGHLQPEEFWIDYVADTGDGWNSTYAVAYWLAQPTLTPTTSGGAPPQTRSGSILVFGGDQVYPTPSRKEYQRRLVRPYETARRRTEKPHPKVFAIPGNHDWYDSLVSFTRLFLAKGWFAGWECPQERSYFALKLPHGWWLLATDMQLGSDIDQRQVDYFRKVTDKMAKTDRIILCNAEPHWIYSQSYSAYDAEVYSESNLAFLESNKVFGRKIDVTVAGDLHHYRHHEAESTDGRRRHKITAGGGGAFLHPTHGANVSELPGGFRLKACFPDVATSARLCWWNLLFPLLNYKFGILPACLYLVTAWATMADVGNFGISQTLAAVTTTLKAVLGNPTAAFWGALLFAGFFTFTDTHSKTYRFTAGSIHGLSHLVAVFFISWGASYLVLHLPGLNLQFRDPAQLLLSGLIIFAAGWVVGTFIMGVYLLVSLNLFGRHKNEAFSSLAIPDWKHFLRFKVDASGLTIYPIGLRRVPRKWKKREGTTGPELVPDDPRATPPELIEAPIFLPHRKDKTEGAQVLK